MFGHFSSLQIPPRILPENTGSCSEAANQSSQHAALGRWMHARPLFEQSHLVVEPHEIGPSPMGLHSILHVANPVERP